MCSVAPSAWHFFLPQTNVPRTTGDSNWVTLFCFFFSVGLLHHTTMRASLPRFAKPAAKRLKLAGQTEGAALPLPLFFFLSPSPSRNEEARWLFCRHRFCIQQVLRELLSAFLGSIVRIHPILSFTAQSRFGPFFFSGHFSVLRHYFLKK